MAALEKKQGWDVALAQFIVSRMRQPAEWGRNDCCLFAADGVSAQYGGDFGAFCRGQYADEAGAARFIAEQTGGGTFSDFVHRVMASHGFPRIERAYAKRGDVVMFTGVRGLTLGLIDLDGKTMLAPADKGLGRVPLWGTQVRCWGLS